MDWVNRATPLGMSGLRSWTVSIVVVGGILAMACNHDAEKSGAGGPASGLAGGPTQTRTYTVFWNAMAQDPPGGIKITIAVPIAWSESRASSGAPKFTVPGVSLPGPTVSATSCGSKDFATCIGPMMEPGNRRTDLSGGRVWSVQDSPNGGVTGRIFVPAPATGSVVMCMVVLPKDLASQLDAFRPFVESIVVAGG
jgi:hypothetical protein